MNHVPFVSIIVPVYNVEAYVGECIESILSQTYDRIQIILVDDGSTDGSCEICDSYGRRDSRIRVVHKRNGGLSDARNVGLAVAEGDFVSFIDSDDRVSPVFIETLCVAAGQSNCGLVAVPGGRPFRDGDMVELEDDVVLDGRLRVLSDVEYLRLMFYQKIVTGAPWRLYARAVLGDSPFPKGLYYEDLASTYRFVRSAGKVALVDCFGLYAYRLRPDGIIRQKYTPLKASSAITVSRQLYGDICSWYPDLEEAAASRCFSANRMVFAQIPSSEIRDRRRIWEELVRYRKVVACDPSARKRDRLASVISFFGLNGFSLFCAVCRKMGLLR